MFRNKLILKNVLAIAICFAVTTMFSGCEKDNDTLSMEDYTPLKLNYGRFYVYEEQNDERYTVIRLELAENDFDISDNRIFYFDIYNKAGNDSIDGSVGRNISKEIKFYGDVLTGYKDSATGLSKGAYYREIENHDIFYEELIQGSSLRIWDSRDEYYPYDDKTGYKIDGWVNYKEKTYTFINTIEFQGEIVRREI